MGAVGADLCAAILSEWFGCEIEVVVAQLTVAVLFVPAAGYLIYADKNFRDDDWDEAIGCLPRGLCIDYAQGDWDIAKNHQFLDTGTDCYWAPLSSANIAIRRSDHVGDAYPEGGQQTSSRSC